MFNTIKMAVQNFLQEFCTAVFFISQELVPTFEGAMKMVLKLVII